MWRLRYDFAAIILPGRFTIPRLKEQKLTKFVYFVETMMCESSIFQINMIVCINLAVNSVLLRFGVMPVILR